VTAVQVWVIISGHGTVETAVSAIRKGAYDYIVKPFKADKLLVTASRALENARLRRENEELKGKTASDYTLVGSSPQIIQLRQKITKIAATNSRVLITGPSGSGKELIARLLHNQSVREQGPFKAVNAASMVPERVEEELFGTEDDEGNSTKIGLLERAARQIGGDAMAALQAHDWPGNVRQLRNNVERLLILATGDPSHPITLETLPPEVSVVRSSKGANEDEKIIAMPLRDAREHFEREYLQAQIDRFGGNISRTANFVGMERSALHRKLKSLGLGANGRDD